MRSHFNQEKSLMSNKIYVRNEREIHSKKLKYLFLFILVFLLGALVVLSRLSGNWLVESDPLSGYRWGLVLDGQGREMNRSDGAKELLEQGVIDTIVLSGSRNFRNRYNSEFYAQDLLMQKVDAQRILEMRHDAYSTFEEAMVAIPFFRELDADTVLLITSNFHTRRAKNIFNTLAKGSPVFVSYAVEDPHFHTDNWVFEKEAAAIWLVEILKHLQTSYELWKNKEGHLPQPIWENWVHLRKVRDFSDQNSSEVVMNSLETLFDSLSDEGQLDSLKPSVDSLEWKDSLQ